MKERMEAWQEDITNLYPGVLRAGVFTICPCGLP